MNRDPVLAWAEKLAPIMDRLTELAIAFTAGYFLAAVVASRFWEVAGR